MKNIKISTKLIMLVMLFSIITLLIAFNGINDLAKVEAGVQTLYKDRVIPLKQLKLVSDAYAVHIVNAMQKEKAGEYSVNHALNELDEAKKSIDEHWAKYLETHIEGEELRLVNEAKSFKIAADQAVNDLYNLCALQKDSLSIATHDNYISFEMYPKIEPFTEKISELIDIQIELSQNIKDESEAIYEKSKTQSYILLIIGILSSTLFAFLIITGINRSLKQANDSILKLTQGDLTYEINVDSNDEIGLMLRNLKKTFDRLRDIVMGITAGSNQIYSASNEMSASAQQMSQGSNEQASSTEEVSSTMEEMQSNIQQNADNAKQTEVIATKAAVDIEEGSKTVLETVKSMKTIAEKISIIREIAYQTNILALNAAVEAARAGDEGKGFAVVAAEVRSLAERSRNAAEEIEKISSSSVEVAENSGKILAEIVPDIKKTARLVQDITSASVEQASSINQVTNAVEQLNQVTQQISAISEEVASSSEELESQAEQLENSINFFKTGNNQFGKTQSRVKKTHMKNFIHQKEDNSKLKTEGYQIDLANTEVADGNFEKY